MIFRQIGNEARTRYLVDNKPVTKEEFDRLFAEEKATLPQIAPPEDLEEGLEGNRPWTKAIVSDALAYHPRQVAEARDYLAKRGISPDVVRPDGKVVLPDRATRRQLLRVNRMHDNGGGYSD